MIPSKYAMDSIRDWSAFHEGPHFSVILKLNIFAYLDFFLGCVSILTGEQMNCLLLFAVPRTSYFGALAVSISLARVKIKKHWRNEQ